MKKVIFTIIAGFLLFSSCKKDENISPLIVGSWELVSLEGASGLDGLSVWIEFAEDCSFNIYQRVGSETMYRKMSGTWTVSGSTLTGSYDDGVPWASGYDITADDVELKLTSRTPEKEKTIYRKATIPESVTSNVSNKR